MTTPGERSITVADMETLVREHRRLLEALEARLSESTTSPVEPSTPPADSGTATGARQARIARNEVRRAARRASRTGGAAILLPRPPDGREYLQSIAGARSRAWERTSEAMRLLESGDVVGARVTLDEVLHIESTIENEIDSIVVAPAWRALQDEVLQAGDDGTDAVRAALLAVQRQPVATKEAVAHLSAALGAGSHWLRSWRAFVQIAPSVRS